jgi:hypothetical protein
MMTRTITTRSVTSGAAASTSAHDRSHIRSAAGKGKAVGPKQTPTPPNADRESSTTTDPNNHEDPPDDPEIPNNPDDPDNDPDDPDDNDEPQQDLPDKPDELSAGEAVRLLVNVLKSTGKPPKSKVREPDTFDRSNLKKLQTFLAQCRLNFQDQPMSYPSERSKVTYALSYLSGTAMQWFEPVILEPPTLNANHFMNDYGLFVDELKLNFGP